MSLVVKLIMLLIMACLYPRWRDHQYYKCLDYVNEVFIAFYFTCLGILCACMTEHHIVACGGQKREADPLELE